MTERETMFHTVLHTEQLGHLKDRGELAEERLILADWLEEHGEEELAAAYRFTYAQGLRPASNGGGRADPRRAWSICDTRYAHPWSLGIDPRGVPLWEKLDLYSGAITWWAFPSDEEAVLALYRLACWLELEQCPPGKFRSLARLSDRLRRANVNAGASLVSS